LVPEKEKLGILGCLFTSSIFEGRAPAGHVMLTTFVGGMRQPAHASLPETELIGLVRENLVELLGVKGKPKFVHVTKWKRAIPQYEVGFGSYLDRMHAIEEANPGFTFAGNYKTGISLDNCVKSGWDITSS
jgi:protoporphyrinogen/coproporphyrinogen III oxidase